ncbi:unnamed protein product [Ectocarpus sp. 12 AP-2014]
MHRTKSASTAGQTEMEEDASIDACFDYFRRAGSVVDVQWVKEQIYRTSCVPERCPPTRSLGEILSLRGDSDELKKYCTKSVFED